MPKKLGRPTDNPKNIRLEVRITQDTADDLKECSEKLNIPRVAVIEKGIELVKSQLDKKK
jgi:hypothetical protein